MFSWQIWDANLTDNSKIGDEFEQNKHSEVCIVNFWTRIHPLSILELSVKCVSQICHENINKPLDGAYLADYGIDITHMWLVFALLFFAKSHYWCRPPGFAADMMDKGLSEIITDPIKPDWST